VTQQLALQLHFVYSIAGDC